MSSYLLLMETCRKSRFRTRSNASSRSSVSRFHFQCLVCKPGSRMKISSLILPVPVEVEEMSKVGAEKLSQAKMHGWMISIGRVDLSKLHGPHFGSTTM